MYFLLKCTPNKADPVGNHLYHVSEEVWTPSPGKGTGAAGGLGPPPEECDPGRQGCRTPRSRDGLGSEGQGGYHAICNSSFISAKTVALPLKAQNLDRFPKPLFGRANLPKAQNSSKCSVSQNPRGRVCLLPLCGEPPTRSLLGGDSEVRCKRALLNSKLTTPPLLGCLRWRCATAQAASGAPAPPKNGLEKEGA